MENEIKNEEMPEQEQSQQPEAAEAAAEIEQVEEVGNIKISVDVVSTIAGIAASEIPGIAGMYSSFANGIAEKFGAKKNQTKGVKVEMNANAVLIDLYIVVEYGVKIPELAWEVQESVKTNVETMTGLTVEKVNIHIEGVSFTRQEDTAAVPQTEAEEE